MGTSFRRLFGLILAFAALPASAAAPGRILYSEPLAGLAMTKAANAAAPRSRLDFDAFGRRFAIELEPNRRLLDAVGRQGLPPDVAVYRGRVAGAQGSWARIVIADGKPAGLVHDGQDYYAIEAPGNGAAPVIFRLADLDLESAALGCASSATSGSAMLDTLGTEFAKAAALAPGAVSQIDFALIGDFEFSSSYGAAAQTAIVTRMNNVDGIFSEQLGVQLNLNRIDIFTTASDPFSNTTVPNDLLDELGQYRQNNAAQRANGLTHLFTGRDLDGTTVGIAFTGALCHPRAGAGLTQGTASVTSDSLVAAHEIGHNFGAPHDGESGSACSSTPQNFLMAPRINGSDRFSACSINQVQDDIAAASCITPLPATDVEVVAGSVPGSVFLGDAATIEFDVNAVGTETANDVTLAVNVPQGAQLDAATATAGSCTTGAGNVDCALGSIAAGSGVTVAVTVTTTTTGTLNFAATATATDDVDAGNNDDTASLVVLPAVDLAVTVPAAAQLAVNQTATFRPLVENRSSIVVTDVVVTVFPSAGLRIESASWPAGSCTAEPGRATCNASSLAAQSSQAIELGITGVSDGTRTYTVEATSAAADRNAGNNSATGQIAVGDVSTGSTGQGDSGGGGAGGIGLLLLSLALLRPRRRHDRRHAAMRGDEVFYTAGRVAAASRIPDLR